MRWRACWHRGSKRLLKNRLESRWGQNRLRVFVRHAGRVGGLPVGNAGGSGVAGWQRHSENEPWRRRESAPRHPHIRNKPRLGSTGARVALELRRPPPAPAFFLTASPTMNRHCQNFLLVVPVVAILLGWYAANTLCADSPSAAEQVRWVRTADGWEKAWWLRQPPPSTAPLVHPALVATFMLLSSIGLLTVTRGSQPPATTTTRFLEIAPEDRL